MEIRARIPYMNELKILKSNSKRRKQCTVYKKHVRVSSGSLMYLNIFWRI